MANTDFLTIRQAAKRGPLSEHYLRLMRAQGRLPGIETGNRFLINYPVFLSVLDAQSRANAQGSSAGQRPL